MKEPEKRPEIHSAITEALRRKRGELKPAPVADLAAMEATLLAEIEAFALRPEPLALPSSESPGGENQFARPIENLFPKISADQLTPPEALQRPADGGLLEQFRLQALARQQKDTSRQEQMTAAGQRLDAALRCIFAYCHELVQQLNIVRPPIERPYSMAGNLTFSGLAWKEGFTDYRTCSDSALAVYEAVSLSCQLAGPETLRIERDGLSAETFRKSLFDHGLVFTGEEVRNNRHMVEKVMFSIAPEVRINVRWRADPAREVLVLESRNLERFGSVSYTVAPEEVGFVMLDEFTRLLLGQASRFRDFCRHVGPATYNR